MFLPGLPRPDQKIVTRMLACDLFAVAILLHNSVFKINVSINSCHNLPQYTQKKPKQSRFENSKICCCKVNFECQLNASMWCPKM